MAVAYRNREHHDVYHVSYGSLPVCLVSRDPVYHMSWIPNFQELSSVLSFEQVESAKKAWEILGLRR